MYNQRLDREAYRNLLGHAGVAPELIEGIIDLFEDAAALNEHQLADMGPGVFAVGTSEKLPNPTGAIAGWRSWGKSLQWVAKRRGGPLDWCIYYGPTDWPIGKILVQGLKVTDEDLIRELVPCNLTAYEAYAR